MEKKNRKPLVALLLVAVLGVVGVTIAYFASTDTFANVFSTKAYNVSVQETFDSPENWVPGDTTTKTINVTNNGDVDVAVRVSYTEAWKDASNANLPLTFTYTDNQNVEHTENAAVINFASNYTTNWTKSTENGTDYYYYKTALTKNQSTSNLIESVTFNPEVEGTVISQSANDNCTTSTNTEGKTVKTCNTTIGGYAGGQYTLTITAETIQYDQYKTAWGTNVTIATPTEPQNP